MPAESKPIYIAHRASLRAMFGANILHLKLKPSMPALRLTFIVGAFFLFAAMETAIAQPKTIRVTANLPLSGDLGQYGTAIQQGSLLAESDLKQGSGGKSSIQFDWQDNKGNNRDAYTIMSAQLASHPDIYISGLKPQTMTITDQVSKSGIPHFTWILDVKINPNSSNCRGRTRVYTQFRQCTPFSMDKAFFG